jgi:hypothetical protein
VASQIPQKDLHTEFLQEKLQLYPHQALLLKQAQLIINPWKISKKWLHTLTKSTRQISKVKSHLEKEQEAKSARRQFLSREKNLKSDFNLSYKRTS